MSKKKSSKSCEIHIDTDECIDNADECFFSDSFIPEDECISAFSFTKDIAQPENTIPINSLSNSELIKSNKKLAYGITPPIDGEMFDIKRSYTFRQSTVRKLNELKAIHPDINVYMNTIVDAAINYYYNYIINENGSQI